MSELRVFQSLWATEMRRPGVPEAPIPERFDRVKDAGYDGLAIDLGATDLLVAQSCIGEYLRTGLKGLVIAFPTSIEALRPALHLAKEIGAPFVVVIGKVMPLAVEDMIPVVRGWMRLAAEESVPIQFETHRNCITNDLYTTVQLLDAIPEMRMTADLSHYVVDREMPCPPSALLQELIGRVLDRCDSFQGRIAGRGQIQLPLHFPQNQKWVNLFKQWWREGFASWISRHAASAEPLIFTCELGPPDYAITDCEGREMSNRWAESLQIADWVRGLWKETVDAGNAAKSHSA